MTLYPVDGYALGMRTTLTSYQFRIRGHVDETLSDWFTPMSVANEPNGEATLTGPVRDQAELYGILMKLYNLNFTLIAVQRMQTTDEPSSQRGQS
jgi:hypothetical protein